MNDPVTVLFDRVARHYDHPVLQEAVYQPVQDQIVAELSRLRPRRILDVGCGTGILAARLVNELVPERVVGCDRSAGMLDLARQRSAAVEWLEGSAESVPLEDMSFDALLTTTAVHFFDQPAALREFRRVLAPGGVLFVAAATTLGPIASALLRPAAHVPTRRGLRSMVVRAGFVDVARLPPARGLLGLADPMVVVRATRPT